MEFSPETMKVLAESYERAKQIFDEIQASRNLDFKTLHEQILQITNNICSIKDTTSEDSFKAYENLKFDMLETAEMTPYVNIYEGMVELLRSMISDIESTIRGPETIRYYVDGRDNSEN